MNPKDKLEPGQPRSIAAATERASCAERAAYDAGRAIGRAEATYLEQARARLTSLVSRARGDHDAAVSAYLAACPVRDHKRDDDDECGNSEHAHLRREERSRRAQLLAAEAALADLPVSFPISCLDASTELSK